MALHPPSAVPEEIAGGEPEPPVEESYERRTLFCGHCGLARVFQRRRVRTQLHLVLSMGTLGLWLPVWGILRLWQRKRPWICTECGARQTDNSLYRHKSVDGE